MRTGEIVGSCLINIEGPTLNDKVLRPHENGAHISVIHEMMFGLYGSTQTGTDCEPWSSLVVSPENLGSRCRSSSMGGGSKRERRETLKETRVGVKGCI
jgi:hypothetical protein